MNNHVWPGLPLEERQETYATLHRWTQIVGKIRLAQTPLVNHWWNVTLYVAARGLTTSVMPYQDRSFFWGSFDLAVTRFSGRRAPEREGADPITREAYSHECIGRGFWLGQRASGPVERSESDGTTHAPAFYSYTPPEPPGLKEASIRPGRAFHSQHLKKFILLYDDVRQADSPEPVLMHFLQSTYEAEADLAKWDRAALERAANR
jgi:Family of unknown function (DUF5996)